MQEVSIGKKACQRVFDELRRVEANAAEVENLSIKRAGQVTTQKNIEGDGTVGRKLVISRRNLYFVKERRSRDQAQASRQAAQANPRKLAGTRSLRWPA